MSGRKIKPGHAVLGVVILFLMFATGIGFASTSTGISLVLENRANNTLVSGYHNLTVLVSTNSSNCSSGIIHNQTFTNGIYNGRSNATLTNMNTTYNTLYYFCYQIDNTQLNGTDQSIVGQGTINPNDLNNSASFNFTSLNVVNSITAVNLTATSWFLGLFNWVIATNSTSYLVFNGTTLSFNVANLNNQITLDATNITSGTLSTARLPSNITYTNSSNDIQSANLSCSFIKGGSDTDYCTDAGATASEAPRGAYSNLQARNISVDSVNITADSVVLYDGSVSLEKRAVNLLVNISTSGVNGLDTGTEANSTWYYVYVIGNSTNTSGLLSISSTSPTMPSGYTYSKLVSSVRNNGTGNFLPFKQNNDYIRYYGWGDAADANAYGWLILSGVNLASWSAVDASSYTSSIAYSIVIGGFSGGRVYVKETDDAGNGIYVAANNPFFVTVGLNSTQGFLHFEEAGGSLYLGTYGYYITI